MLECWRLHKQQFLTFYISHSIHSMLYSFHAEKMQKYHLPYFHNNYGTIKTSKLIITPSFTTLFLKSFSNLRLVTSKADVN